MVEQDNDLKYELDEKITMELYNMSKCRSRTNLKSESDNYSTSSESQIVENIKIMLKSCTPVLQTK